MGADKAVDAAEFENEENVCTLQSAVYMWGRGDDGQLGTGSAQSLEAPTRIRRFPEQ